MIRLPAIKREKKNAKLSTSFRPICLIDGRIWIHLNSRSLVWTSSIWTSLVWTLKFTWRPFVGISNLKEQANRMCVRHLARSAHWGLTENSSGISGRLLQKADCTSSGQAKRKCFGNIRKDQIAKWSSLNSYHYSYSHFYCKVWPLLYHPID